MSYTVRLENEQGYAVEVPPHNEGSIVTPGDNRASVNVTYNYSYFYYNEIDKEGGIRWLHRKKAKETKVKLEEAIEVLGDEPHKDCQSYWCPSKGNAGKILALLLEWAKQHPEAIWCIEG